MTKQNKKARGKLMQAGLITTRDCIGTAAHYTYAILIQFKTRDDLMAALDAERCRFGFGAYPAKTWRTK